jgi:hypothetical protein
LIQIFVSKLGTRRMWDGNAILAGWQTHANLSRSCPMAGSGITGAHSSGSNRWLEEQRLLIQGGAETIRRFKFSAMPTSV